MAQAPPGFGDNFVHIPSSLRLNEPLGVSSPKYSFNPCRYSDVRLSGAL